ncbi:retrovirus-related pol polyprotein from transposon TNT 1-94 [Tanacetum coccineum]|uniref:Retrovirus-related pol polyprotein from transposon TNT 1-94 n=1 Tax=Tanacetum coccineum TaxID=301880 RepID=A0ABQ5A9W2_9ASTR
MDVRAFDLINQLRLAFHAQSRTERFNAIVNLSNCKIVEGLPMSAHVIKMIGHISRQKRLGHTIVPELTIDFILNSLSEEYKQFILNYNMNNVEGGTVAELHNMLKTAERCIDQKPKDVLGVASRNHNKNRENKGTGRELVQMVQQKKDKENTAKTSVTAAKLLGEKISQEDVNQKLLRSLSPEWNTHTVVWRNKADLDTMSMDDLYNNLKVYELEVKGISTSNLSTQNMDFVSSSNNNTSNSNEAVNVSHGVTTASTQVNIAYFTNIDNLSDSVICSFFASQPNSPQLAHEELQQIHLDDIEEMDLRWQWPLECYNCHKRRHFARECRAPRNQDNKKESSRKSMPVEKSTSTALVSCDGLGGYDWSYQAEEGLNYELMAYSSSSFDSKVSNDSNCTDIAKISRKRSKPDKHELGKGKRIQEPGECYQSNHELRKKLEKLQKEKDSIQFNVDKFENASKSLDMLIECPIVDNCKKGLGYEKYNVVPPPYTGNFIHLKFVNKPVVENRKCDEEVSEIVRKNDDALIIEEYVSDSEEENVSQPKTEKKTVKPSIAKIEFVKPKQQEKTVKQAEKNRQNTHIPRGNQRNWNNMMSQKLGSNFEMFNKACYMCGSFDHFQYRGVIDSGCSRHMTGNMSYLTNYDEIDGGYIAFGGNLKGGKTTRKCTIKTVDHKVKVIRCDNGTELKNKEMNQFCEMKGILRQYSVARTPQQNEVAARRNRTLIEAVRTMLADSKLPTTFWAEVINTACYVHNRVLVFKPHNKTLYELFHGRTPTLSFMRPFRCPVIFFNTINHLGKFDGKADECFFYGYSLNSKAFRGEDPFWLFDIDALTRTINYEPIIACTQSNGFAGTKASDNAGQARKETGPKVDEDPRKDSESNDQEKEDNVNSTNNVNVASTNEVNVVGGKTSIELPNDPNMPTLEDYSIFDFTRTDEDDDVEADMDNLDTTIQVSPILTKRIHKDHPLDQVIGDL